MNCFKGHIKVSSVTSFQFLLSKVLTKKSSLDYPSIANPPPAAFYPQRPHSLNGSYPQIQINHHILLLNLGLTKQTKIHTTTSAHFTKLIS